MLARYNKYQYHPIDFSDQKSLTQIALDSLFLFLHLAGAWTELSSVQYTWRTLTPSFGYAKYNNQPQL